MRRGKEVPTILRQISDNLKRLVNGTNITSPFWTLESTANPDVVKFDLASVHDKYKYGPPSMLLYNVGCFEKDPILKERLHYIYSKGQDTCVNCVHLAGKC